MSAEHETTIDTAVDQATKNPAVREIRVLSGEAKADRHPPKTRRNTLITGPANYYLKRQHDPGNILKDRARIEVDAEDFEITLFCNEDDHQETVMCGQLKKDIRYTDLHINNEYGFSPKNLADIIRKFRHWFTSPAKAVELITALRNVEATIKRTRRNSDDERGNVEASIVQTVESSFDSAKHVFELSVPFFKGEERTVIKIEPYLTAKNADEFIVVLSCPELDEIIESQAISILQREAERFNNEIAVLFV